MKGNKKQFKIIEKIKRKWLMDSTKTFLLVAIIIVVFIGINSLMKKLELTPIDFTQEKLYTLTEESKEKVKNIEQDVNIYFIGYEENDSNLDLAKQYKKANEKIVAEAVDINSRPDLAQKYGIESGIQGIIVESGEKSKVLSNEDLVTYDMTTYDTINIAEEKLTSSILSVTSAKIPKVYFLEGYSEFSINQNMNYLNMYMQNEVNDIETLNILASGKVPDDCDTLVITTPSRDFDDIATNAIIEYINSGRNILWLNAAQAKEIELSNVNKILSLYALNPFEIGTIRETTTSNMVAESPDLIIPVMDTSKITENINKGTGVIFINGTKININEDKLEEQNVEEIPLIYTTEGAYFRKDFNNTINAPAEGEEKTEYILGVELDKTIKEANEETGENELTSKLIIYGENIFASDYQIIQSSQYPAIQFAQNKDLILNSIAYLVERPEDITARKSTGSVTYTATAKQDKIIRIIIFTIPILIMILGIIIWIKRKRRN